MWPWSSPLPLPLLAATGNPASLDKRAALIVDTGVGHMLAEWLCRVTRGNGPCNHVGVGGSRRWGSARRRRRVKGGEEESQVAGGWRAGGWVGGSGEAPSVLCCATLKEGECVDPSELTEEATLPLAPEARRPGPQLNVACTSF